jgi:uncharacterized membrane protein YbhN (UPF0104 family)
VSKRGGIRLLGSGVLLGLVAWRLDCRQLADAFSGLDPRFWGLAVGVYLFAQVVSSLRWQMLSVPLGFSVPWRAYLSLYFLGMFFNLLLPTSVGGDVVRAVFLGAGQRLDRRGERAALSVFADRASGLAVLVAIACAAGFFVPLPPWMQAILLGLGGCVLVGLLVLPALPLLGRLPLVGAHLGRLVDAGRVYLRLPGLLFWAMLLSVLVQGANVVLVWLIAKGLGLAVPLTLLCVVVPLVTLLTLLPVSVGGLGLREVGMVVLLAPVGVGSAEAVSLSLLTFAANAAVSLIGFGLYLFGRYPRYRAEGGMEGVSDANPDRGGADQGRDRQPSAAA